MAEAYSERVLDHFRRPRNVGAMEAPDAVGRAENPASGARLHLYLAVEGGRIRRATFRAEGCAATIAAGSVTTELLPGRRLDVPNALSRDEVAAALDGLPPTRRHAAALAVAAVRSAALDYATRGTAVPPSTCGSG